MDITTLSTSYTTGMLMSQVSNSVLAMSMDTMKTEAEGFQKALEASVNPHIGQNIDISL